MRLNVNGRSHDLGDIDPTTPLLWVLRDTLELVGTKYGCGIGACSACTVHVNGAPVQSCQLPVQSVEGMSIRTIEGVAQADGTLHPVQQAWIDEDVAQCGYCQAGQIMSAVALLERTPQPTETDIENAMSRHLCRCGTYNRIRKAIRVAAGMIEKTGSEA